MFKKTKKIILTILTTTLLAVCMIVPAFAADSTLALSPRFNAVSYAALNPQTAAACNCDPVAMYNYYMTTGVKQGQRIYPTLLPTNNEMLFLYMANNRSYYVKNGLNVGFPYFNLTNYMLMNPDLVLLYGNNPAMYLYHYINYGIYEGRSSGSAFDPARAIVWNSGIAALCNPTLDPGRIYGNYAATTGLATTANIQVVSDATGNLFAKQVYVAPAPVYGDEVRPASCASEHFWDYYYKDGAHKRRCRRCDRVESTDQHSYELKSADDATHTYKCGCGDTYAEPHRYNAEKKACDKCGHGMCPPAPASAPAPAIDPPAAASAPAPAIDPPAPVSDPAPMSDGAPVGEPSLDQGNDQGPAADQSPAADQTPAPDETPAPDPIPVDPPLE